MDSIPFFIFVAVFALFFLALAVIVIVFWWKRYGAGRRIDKPFIEHDVEFEWTVKPSSALRATAIFLLLLVPLGYMLLDDKDSESKLIQSGIALIAAVAGLLGGQGSRTYQITGEGLYQKESPKKKKSKLLFAWADVDWIKPESDDFSYQLKPHTPILSDYSPAFLPRKGKIRCGKETTLIVSMILAKGVSVGPRE
jgi:hypothetical protein